MADNQSDTLLIGIQADSLRVRYAFSLLFEWVYPLPYELTTDRARWAAHAGPRLWYGQRPPASGDFWLPAAGLLWEKGISSREVEVETVDGLPCFFRPARGIASWPFDLPALAFYLATRYEEYLPFQPDVHGRFPASESLAARAGFLQLPLVNLWARRLVGRLGEKFPAMQVDKPAFRFLPTFDIDMAWAFRHRPWWVQLGGAGKAALDGRWADLWARGRALFGRAPDPFYSFPLLRQLHPPGEAPAPVFFFLLADYGPYDKNTRHTNRAFRRLLAGLAEDYPTGIHLSYRSNQKPDRIPVEIGRLEEITDKAAQRNRQHFLKLRLPDTYRQLLQNGIREDYTMGYADAIGFRAGLANPFPWYDLLREETTPLIIYPFQVMDVTLKNYLGWTPGRAWAPVWEMVERTRAAGGLFSTLWHNSSFGPLEGWRPWISFYQQLIREIKALK